MITDHQPRNTKISVVIPLYNKEKNIKRCIDSIKNQKTQASEIIVVDDGSTDSSKNLVLNNFPDVTVLEQKNQGVSVARNKGLKNSKTPYVAFLDADDWWLPGAIEKFFTQIQTHPHAVLYCVSYFRFNGDKYLELPNGMNSDRCMAGQDFIDIYRKHSGVVHSSSVCVEKDTFLRVGGFPENYDQGEDIYTWVSLALAGPVVATNERLSVNSREKHELFSHKNRTSIPAYIDLLTEKKRLLKLPSKARKTLEKFVAYRGCKHAFALSQKGQPELSIKILKKIFWSNVTLCSATFLAISLPKSITHNIAKTLSR